MNDFLNATGAVIAQWLEARLPRLSSDWWKEQVVQRLTFQQQRLVEERRITSLSSLDFAAVLRVLDQNWGELSAIENLPREARTWVKELQSIRNRWAHAPLSGLSATDTFRDADTLERLLLVLSENSGLLEKLGKFKLVALSQLNSSDKPSANGQNAPIAVPIVEPVTKVSESAYSVGQLVCLRSNSAMIFPILEVLASSNGETRYQVFENGSRQVYYESQLQSLEEPKSSQDVLTAHELSALLTAIQLSAPSASSLYSLNSGRVRFVPYQYRPVFKLIRADRPRLLIADEVGVGKTIEAGLIIKELKARNDIKSILIICPKALVAERKWELEMKRFDEHFVPLDGSLLRHCIKETHLSGEWPVQYEKAIIPTSLFDSDLLFGKAGKTKSKDLGLLELDPPPRFDLVIVDEAHHIRNSDTYLHQAVRYFSDNAEAVVFLSATPVQLGREDLYTLLNVLRPDVIIDPASFAQMAEPNRFIYEGIHACRTGQNGWAEEVSEKLRSVAATSWGKEVLAVTPGFQNVYDSLKETSHDSLARVKTIHALEELYSFGSLINRTRRRDIGEFTTRKAETVTTEFTESQKAFHDDLLGVISRILGRLHGNQNVKFMMTTVSRQAASSLYGIAPALEDILHGKLARLIEEDDGAEQPDERSFAFVEEIRSEVESLLSRARTLEPYDPKAVAFLKVVGDKLLMPKNKVLVFSTFRHTLKYLVQKLSSLEVRFGLVHGGISDEERSSLRHRFSLAKENPDALDVLLSSEVGCEGLDFQFCDCLVNYDLPWNPMRIEQRIGRIDRYGQQSETVAIFNFVTPGTIDADIYNRCLWRIGIFQHAIGGCEEILGDITRELHDIAESYALNDAQRSERLQQLADNKVRQIEEEQRLEERQGEFFGLNLSSASWEERFQKSRNHWLEPQALVLAVNCYLTSRLGKEQEYLLGEKPLKTLRLNMEARTSLLDDYRKLSRSTDPVFRAWEKWLKGTTPTLQITFDQEVAVQNSECVLVSLGHPLLRQATAYLKKSEAVIVRLNLTHKSAPVGIFPFALYQWVKQGVKRDEQLVPVTANSEVTGLILSLLPESDDAPQLELPAQSEWDSLDSFHHEYWLRETTQHAEENRQLVGVRIQSLSASFRARKNLLERQINQATNEKIRLMKQAELERAQVDFDRRISTLSKSAESGDIRATPIVFGVIEIRRAS